MEGERTVHLGDDGDDRHELGQLGHQLHVPGLQVVGRQEDQRHVDPGVGQVAEGHHAARVLLLGHVVPALLQDVLQDGGVHSWDVRPRGVLQNAPRLSIPQFPCRLGG